MSVLPVAYSSRALSTSARSLTRCLPFTDERFGKQIWTSKSQLQVNDGFYVHESANIADTISYLRKRTQVMCEIYEVSPVVLETALFPMLTSSSLSRRSRKIFTSFPTTASTVRHTSRCSSTSARPNPPPLT